jgi:hypothetical protein
MARRCHCTAQRHLPITFIRVSSVADESLLIVELIRVSSVADESLSIVELIHVSSVADESLSIVELIRVSSVFHPWLTNLGHWQLSLTRGATFRDL